MIRLGYVGVNTQLPSASRTFRIKNYSEERMLEVARENLLALEQILHWNFAHQIALFRITSHLIPYGSSPINSGIWKDVLAKDFIRIGDYIKTKKMRVSMHPGQYTVLNTPHQQFFANSLSDLEYHNSVLTLMSLDASNRIVVHIGGIYGNKKKSIEVFKERFGQLALDIQRRLTIENDERNFNASEVLSIAMDLGVPATIDLFHYQILPSFEDFSTRDLILLFSQTWKGERQKIHYSNQEPNKRKGAHSKSVDLELFQQFYKEIQDLNLDIMLEVKDKEKSVLAVRKVLPEIH